MKKILLILLTTFLITRIALGESKPYFNVPRYEALYKAGQYQDIVNEFQGYLKFIRGGDSQSSVGWTGPKLGPNLSESEFAQLFLIIADSYRMLQKYTKSALLYADIIGYAFDDEYSNNAEYNFTVYKKIGITEAWIPDSPKKDIFTRYTFGTNPQHESIFEAILRKLTDDTSLSEKKQYFKNLALNDKNNDWVTELSEFCAGDSSLDKVIAITPNENIGIVYVYAGLYLDIFGDHSSARSLYQKALAQKESDNIELLLAANRLGLFSIKIIGVKGREIVRFTDIYSIKASSAKYEDKLYPVQNLIDNNLQTAWVPESKKSGIGEWTEISFDDPVWINSLTLTNGYTKNDVVFKNNNRIKTATLFFSDGSKTKISLNDSMEPQAIKINKKTRTVRIIIDEIYKGTKYDDTCLSEIDVDFKP